MSFTLLLAACAGGGSDAEDNQQGDAQSGTEKDLVLAVHSDASTLDPAGSNDVPSHNIQGPIFESLVKRDSENNLIPAWQRNGK